MKHCSTTCYILLQKKREKTKNDFFLLFLRIVTKFMYVFFFCSIVLKHNPDRHINSLVEWLLCSGRVLAGTVRIQKIYFINYTIFLYKYDATLYIIYIHYLYYNKHQKNKIKRVFLLVAVLDGSECLSSPFNSHAELCVMYWLLNSRTTLFTPLFLSLL